MRKIRETLEFSVSPEFAGKRLDLFLSTSYPELSRSYIKKLIEEGYVFVNSEEKKPSYKLREGEKVYLSIPEVQNMEVKPEDIPIDILYEDKDIAVVVKPCGLVVHPSPGYATGTLVNALLYHLDNLSGIGGVERPGIVHRLDKETSGVMVVAKNDTAHRKLVEQFAQRKTKKLYKALVSGIPSKEHGVIEKPIGRHPFDRKRFSASSERSKYAKSEFWLLERFEKLKLSLLKVKIYTGRTHQIRVHLSSIGHPIVGDKTYGFKSPSVPRSILTELEGCNMLTAYLLGFFHPSTGKWLEFKIENPEPFNRVLSKVRELDSPLG